MHLNIHEKYQLLVAIIKTATDAAKQNDKPELKRLEELKKLVDVTLVTNELKAVNPNIKAKSSSEESLKTTYAQVKKELVALLSKLDSKVDFEKLFKPSEKTYKQIKESKGVEFSFADVVAHVQQKLMDVLNLQINYEASSSSSSELKAKAPKETQHGRRRSNTESSIPQISALSSSPKEEKPNSSSSAQLRGEYEQQRSRNLSFYKVPSLNTAVASSSNAKSPRAQQVLTENNLEIYFDELFDSDREKASQFVIALATREYSWGIPALNAASNKNHLDITKTLFENLDETQLIFVFTELLKLEHQQSWCRGNQLIYTLLQHYLAHPNFNDYKKSIWNTVFTLKQPLDKINIKQRSSLLFRPESFAAKQGDIDTLQKAFASVVKQILNPQNFPPLMREIIKCAYHDLVNRNDMGSHDSMMRTLMVFIVLRFINPIILIEAKHHLTLENLNAIGVINLQSEDKDLCNEKLINLQTWYVHTLASAIQAITAPLMQTNGKKATQGSSWIEQQLDKQSLASAMFNIVAHDESFRMELYGAIEESLQLQQISSITPTHNDNKIAPLDSSAAIQQLSELLMTEEFSGLQHRRNGNVITPRKEGKASIFSVFATEPTSPRGDSSTELNSPRQPNV
ncbi:MAG: hypothetical protein P4L79_18280 [Legionella sp.]|uniref:hypothetical protein n=1 Tax=Legionella sp. TaxID=459 RepID=UPI002844E7E3|nr:hypothetical protein [Legionella sp.]